MADRDHDKTQVDTAELLYSDLSDTRSFFLPGPPAVPLDHSDLLHPIDAHLQKPKDISKAADCRDLVSLGWSSFLSKDTGPGSTNQINDTPVTFLDLMHTPMRKNTSDDPLTQKTEENSDTRTTRKEEREIQREQIIWRLKRLLGDTCDETQMTVETQPASESICTEDFFRRFRDEMVDLTVPEVDVQQQNNIEETDGERHKEKRQDLLHTHGKGATISKTSSKATQDPHYCQNHHVSRRTEAVMGIESLQQNNLSSKVKALAGIPMWSFDSVSIDSELDSVCTEQIQQHVNRQAGWRSFLQTDQDRHDYANQNDCDTPTHEENEAQCMSGQRSSGNGQIRSQCNNRETYRAVFSTQNKEADEGREQQMKMCWPNRTEEKMQSDWLKMKDNLIALQQKCKKEEEALKSTKIQIKHAELSLSEVQQRRKHALQELVQLAAEKAEIEKEKHSLELVLRDSRCQQHKLLRQRESCIHERRVVMSVLEREEMDRQLDGAKTQLFAEQRCSREKLQSMQDKLEETCEHLQIVTDSESLLRSRCASLEKKQKEDKEKIEAAEIRVSKLQSELGECTMRKDVLEKTLAQKELQLLDLQQQQEALCAERDGLRGALQLLKAQHSSVVKKAQEQSQRMAQQEKETKKLRDSLEKQKQQAKSQELQVKEAVEEERRRCEGEQVEAVQVQRGTLEEEIRQRLGSMRSEIQRERSVALALKQEVAELRTKLQEMESESCAQQRAQESLLAAVCQTLKEEHKAKLQRLQKDTTQQKQKLVLRLELAQKETERLRMMLEEKESSCNQMTAQTEEQHQHWAQDLQAECRNLYSLLDRSGAKICSVQLPLSSTVAEALTNLRTLREDLKNMMDLLHHRLESQKQTSECMRIRMEQELRLQAKHLRTERDQALKSVQERLIREHIEELSSLKWAHLDDGGAEGGAAASLRKQLQAKDTELRQVQRTMAQWKEETAARLALRFEEELTAELERCKTKLLRSSPSDLASFKLLRHLQDKVKQLRVENQASGCSPSSATTVSSALSGSDTTQVTKGRGPAGSPSHPSVRTGLS